MRQKKTSSLSSLSSQALSSLSSSSLSSPSLPVPSSSLPASSLSSSSLSSSSSVVMEALYKFMGLDKSTLTFEKGSFIFLNIAF